MLAEIPEGTETFTADVTLRSTTNQVLFTVMPVTWVDSSNLEALSFNTRDQQLSSKEAIRGVVNYSMKIAIDPVPNVLEKYDEAAEPRQQFLIGSRRDRSTSIDPNGYSRRWRVADREISELTRDVLRERGIERDRRPVTTPQDEAAMNALVGWFREHFEYSLKNPKGTPAEDPLVRFLFEHRKGHCELFAAGLAAMGRTTGIPTRVVTGYRASEYNRLGQYYMVRHSYAHAWTEAYLGPERGWVAFDATPPGDVAAEHEGQWSMFDPARELYEYLEFVWLSNVVSYNATMRGDLNRDLAAGTEDTVKGIQQMWVSSVVSWFKEQWDRWKSQPEYLILAGLIVFFILVGVVSLLHSAAVKRRRMVTLQLTRLPRKQRRQLVKQLRFYLYMLDLLERHGHVRPLWQSPFSFAKELIADEEHTYDPVLTLTEHFYEIRFGHRTLDAPRRQTIRELLSSLEENLANLKTKGKASKSKAGSGPSGASPAGT